MKDHIRLPESSTQRFDRQNSYCGQYITERMKWVEREDKDQAKDPCKVCIKREALEARHGR